MKLMAAVIAGMVMAGVACGGVDPSGSGAGASNSAAATAMALSCDMCDPAVVNSAIRPNGVLIPGTQCEPVTSTDNACNAAPVSGYLVCCAHSPSPKYAVATKSIVPGGSADPCLMVTEPNGSVNTACVFTTTRATSTNPNGDGSCSGHLEALPQGPATVNADGTVTPGARVTCCCH